jgi:hypothetical protein
MRSLLLMLKPVRFEVLVMAGLSLALSAWAIYVALDISALGNLGDCFRLRDTFQLNDASPCMASLNRFDALRNGEGQQVMSFMSILPFVVGTVLGVMVVARELETGTAPLAWVLARSRRAWLLARLARFAPVAIALMLVPAVAADVLESFLEPTVSPQASFIDWGSRGPLLLVFVLVSLTFATAVGAALGRALPTLLLAGLACLVVQQATPHVMRQILVSQAIEVAPGSTPAAQAAAQRAALSFGAVAYDPAGRVIDDLPAWLASHRSEVASGNGAQLVALVIPGDRYPQVVLFESALALLGSGATVLVALLIVRRRAPY